MADPVFAALRELLLPFADRLVRVTDRDDHLYLDAPHRLANGKPQFFGAVQAGKSGTKLHLMPLYTYPELLDALSPGLRKRLQGKSCFGFKPGTAIEPALLEELTALVRAGFETYRKAGFV